MTARKANSPTFLIVTLMLTACLSNPVEKLPFYNTPDFTPQWIASGSKEYSFVHTIGRFEFINQNGDTITNKKVRGKVYVANFFFTRCTGICIKMTNNLEKVAHAFAGNADVLILSHSVTPETDSVVQLGKYARQHRIDSKNWWLLTGNKEAIYNLARKSYFVDEATGYNPGSSQFLHTENAVLVDKEGRIRGIYNATLELEINKLIEHIVQLLEEE